MPINNPSKLSTLKIILRGGEVLTVVTQLHLALVFLNSMGNEDEDCIHLAHSAGLFNIRRTDIIAANIVESSQFKAEELAELI